MFVECPAITCAQLSDISYGLIYYDIPGEGSANYGGPDAYFDMFTSGSGPVGQFAEGGNLPVGTVAIFRCTHGFAMVGASSSTCEGDGSTPVGMFSPDPPTCESELVPHRNSRYCPTD